MALNKCNFNCVYTIQYNISLHVNNDNYILHFQPEFGIIKSYFNHFKLCFTSPIYFYIFVRFQDSKHSSLVCIFE